MLSASRYVCGILLSLGLIQVQVWSKFLPMSEDTHLMTCDSFAYLIYALHPKFIWYADTSFDISGSILIIYD